MLELLTPDLSGGFKLTTSLQSSVPERMSTNSMSWKLGMSIKGKKLDSRNSATSKMKLFAQVIDGVKAVTHKTHWEKASICKIKLIALCLEVFYCYPEVTNHNSSNNKKTQKNTTLKN